MKRLIVGLQCAFLLSCLSVAVGCNVSDETEDLDPLDCADDECSSGESCYRGGCYRRCDDSGDCAEGDRCYESACIPADCEEMQCYEEETCYRGVCRNQCEEEGDCGEDQACVEGACVALCEEIECSDDQACYRGSCYPGCEEASDCESDERCHAEACVPTDCNGVECYGGETCYYGACYDGCTIDADCQSNVTCTEDACVEACYEDSTGQQVCPDLAFETLAPTGIEPDAAVLQGAITELPTRLPEDHGFCWSDEPDPMPADSDCQYLGAPTRGGIFELAVDGLTPGKEYYARAVVGDSFGNEVAFTTAAPAPTNVNATQGDLGDGVEVTWDGMPGAAEYRVFRDETELDVVDAETTSYFDESAQSPVPGAPQQVQATQEEHPEQITVTWEEVAIDDVEGSAYSVVAGYANTDSAKSEEANGYAETAPVTSYEIEVDGGEWFDVGDTSEYVHDDDEKYATIDAGEVTASMARFEGHVRLEVSGHGVEPGPETTFRVRAINEAGPGEPSDEVTGTTGAELSIQWHRADEPAYSSASSISSSDSSAIYNDSGAPENGEERYYWAVLSPVEGWEVIQDFSGVVGYRGVPPFVYTASEDLTVRRVDAEGRQSWVFEGHQDVVAGIAVDPDGNVYTASHDETVRKLDHNGDEQWVFEGHDGPVNEVAVGSDGFVYTASDDATVRKLYSDDSDVNEEWVFEEHGGAVNDVAVGPEGNIYTGSADNTARMILSNGSQDWVFDEHTDDVRGIAVHSQGVLLTASFDGTVRAIEDGDQIWSYDGHTDSFDQQVQDVAVDANGHVYTAGNDQTVRQLDLDTGAENWVYDDSLDWVLSVEAGNDGRIHVVGRDDVLRRVGVEAVGGPAQEWPFYEHEAAIRDVAVDPGPLGAYPDQW